MINFFHIILSPCRGPLDVHNLFVKPNFIDINFVFATFGKNWSNF